MIEKYFKRGAIFEWVRPRNNVVPPDGTVMDKQRRSTTMTFLGTATEMGFSTYMDPVLTPAYLAANGMTPGKVIDYKWLDYAPGRTSRVPLRQRNILTGPMSGCPILRWQQGGVTYVGHVGTIFGFGAVNALVKAAIQPALPANATGFNPAGAWSPAEIAQNMGSGVPFSGPEILAIVTRQGRFYSTVFYDMPNPRPGMADSRSAKFCGGCKQVTALNGPPMHALLN